jgi:CBS domain-containing protein
MEKIPATVSRTSSIDECLTLMEQNHMNLLPVVEDSGECCGVVIKEDLLRY